MGQHHSVVRLLIVLSTVLFASGAEANPGAALVMAGGVHLLFGNLLIGIGEGLIIALLFRVAARRSVRTMIAANYFSCIIGMLVFALLSLIPQNGSRAPLMTIHNFRVVQAGLLMAAFMLSVILEWPFCLRIFRRARPEATSMLRIAFIASLVAQMASYTVLVPWYLSAAMWRVHNDFAIQRDLGFLGRNPATIYFLRDNAVYRVRVDGTELRRVASLRTDSPSGLLVDGSNGGTSAKLWLWNRSSREPYMLLTKWFAPLSAEWHTNRQRLDKRFFQFPLYSMQFDLRPAGQHEWMANACAWGIGAENRMTGDHLGISIRLPFFEWHGGNVTILQNDLVVAEISNQIVAFDPHSRKLGLIAVGQRPVVTTFSTKEIDHDIRQALE